MYNKTKDNILVLNISNLKMESIRKKYKKFTLVFLKNNDNILLGMKKRGFGQGKWNGFGGKVEENETVENGALREMFEESNLLLKREDIRCLGYVIYHQLLENRIVYIFIATTSNKKFKETEEMAPKWFNIHDIPYEDMWPDSKYWLQHVVAEKGLQARFVYGNDDNILNMQIDEVSTPVNIDIFYL